MVNYLAFFELSEKPFYFGIELPLFVFCFFIFWALLVLFINKIYTGSDPEQLSKLKLFRVVAIAILIFMPIIIFQTISSNIETIKLSAEEKSSQVIEGYITNYREVKKDIGWVEFTINGNEFKTGDNYGYVECKYPSCGLYNGLYVKLSYLQKRFNKIITKVELRQEDHAMAINKMALAKRLCINEGVCRTANTYEPSSVK